MQGRIRHRLLGTRYANAITGTDEREARGGKVVPLIELTKTQASKCPKDCKLFDNEGPYCHRLTSIAPVPCPIKEESNER